MPNTREKLIELLCNFSTPIMFGDVNLMDWAIPTDEIRERLADHLIANGVTIGKPLVEHLHPIDAYEGLKGKYLVIKADTGEQVVNCFVLRPDKDNAAVEALRAYANATENKTLADDIYNWVGKGVTLDNQVSSSKWIPVTERFPEPWKWVLCYCEAGVIEMLRYDDFMDEWGSVNLNGVFMKGYVTHWMPLPEPPKGE